MMQLDFYKMTLLPPPARGEGSSIRRSIFKSFGFTMVELLIVVSIIGVLATLVIPRMFGQSEKARVAEAVNILGAVRSGELAYYDATEQFLALTTATANVTNNDNWRKIGIDNPNSNPNSYWSFETLMYVQNQPQTWCAQATRLVQNDTGQNAGSKLILYFNNSGNKWDGTGNYAPGGILAPQE